MTRVDVERDRRIAKLAEQYTAEQIAVMEGITERSVQRAKQRQRRRLGISPPRPKPFTDAEYARAQELLDDGVCYRDVGRTLGRHPQTIAYHFPGRGWSREQINEARVMSLKLASL